MKHFGEILYTVLQVALTFDSRSFPGNGLLVMVVTKPSASLNLMDFSVLLSTTIYDDIQGHRY